MKIIPPLTAVIRKLKRKGIGALLVSQPDNRRYLSGFTASDSSINESSGFLLVAADGRQFLLTDSRYQLQAEEEVHAGVGVCIYKKGLLSLLKQLLPTLGVSSLAFESDYFLHSKAGQLEKLVQSLHMTLVAETGFFERIRTCKTELEIDQIQQAVTLNEKVFLSVYDNIRPGTTEQEVALEIEHRMRRLGAQGPSFETIVASGPNAAKPHAVPTDRQLALGEPITIDMGLILNGYCSDMTRTFVLGKVDDTYRNIHRTVRKAQVAATARITAGVTGREVDQVAREIIRQAGFGTYFGHGLGHGVGLAVHEAPSLSPRSRKKLSAGMVVTVEPGIYIPGWGGVRLENMVVVREHGCEVLNRDTTFLDI